MEGISIGDEAASDVAAILSHNIKLQKLYFCIMLICKQMVQ